MLRKLPFIRCSKIEQDKSNLIDEIEKKLSRRESCPDPVIKDAFSFDHKSQKKPGSARQSLKISNFDAGIVPSAHNKGYYFEEVNRGAKIDDFRIGQMGFLRKNSCCLVKQNITNSST